MAILDQIESKNIQASNIIAREYQVTGELNPKEYSFLMVFYFVPQIFTTSSILKFTKAVDYIFDANLSEYETILRQMDTENPAFNSEIPVIEEDNLKMLHVSNLDVPHDTYPEKKHVCLMVQFNMPAKVPTIFRVFANLSRICRTYKVEISNVLLNKSALDFSTRIKTIENIEDYMRNAWKLMSQVQKEYIDNRLNDIIATTVNPIIALYTFKENLFENWTDMKDFEYLKGRKIKAVAYLKDVCENMFGCNLEKQLSHYRDYKISKFN